MDGPYRPPGRLHCTYCAFWEKSLELMCMPGDPYVLPPPPPFFFSVSIGEVMEVSVIFSVITISPNLPEFPGSYGAEFSWFGGMVCHVNTGTFLALPKDNDSLETC